MATSATQPGRISEENEYLVLPIKKRIRYDMKKNLLHVIGLLVVSHLLLVSASLAQEKVKPGRIPIADLEMKQYALDTTAHAVVLYDKGHLHSNTHDFTRHLRLKILKPAGTSYANFQVKTTARSDIHGSTFNLVNGQIEETKLTKENIFKEEIVEGYYVYKLFFPSVRPGSVLELRYSFAGLPFEWRFQERIPVVYNELILEPTGSVDYKKTVFGNHPIKNKGYSWIATDVPAFLEEPYMCHYSNYLTHFKFDIRSIFIPGFIHVNVASSWEKIGERLMEMAAFGGVIKNSPFVNAKANEIKKSDAPILEKVHAAYDYIQENIKWNGWTTEFASANYWSNFKTNHSGNSAEVNLLLIALLQKAEINAYPVIMSTRDNGLLNPTSASLTGLNYVVAYVKTDDIELLLDATEPDLIPGILPDRCRNISAYVIDPPGGWWIDTSRGRGNNRKQFILIKPDAENNFIAEVTNTHQDYDYLEWIKKFKETGSEEAYKRFVIANNMQAKITHCEISVDKTKLKASEKRTIDLTNSEVLQDLGSETLINPFLFADILNPFKNEKRQHPVDFIYPRSRSIIISVKIPENYTLRKLPESCMIAPESGGAIFSLVSTLNANLLTIVCTFKIEKQIFVPNEYPELRRFFTETYRKISQPLQIDKKT